MTLGFRVFNSLSPSSDSKEYSIPSYKYTRKDDGWIFLPDLGRSEGCMGAKDVMAENSGAKMEYEIDIVQNDRIAIGILPTQDIYTLKIIMIAPEIVVEQIVVNPDDTRYSYFGKGGL